MESPDDGTMEGPLAYHRRNLMFLSRLALPLQPSSR